MQYIWEHRLLPYAGLCTVKGEKVAIIDPGIRNTGPGPDFFNAKVEVAGQIWAGSVEIHVRASDWFRHHHDGDAAYNGVIFHVVAVDDMPIKRFNGEILPQMTMELNPDLHDQYLQLVNSADRDLPCAQGIASLDSIYKTDFLTGLGFQRIYSKVERIERLLERMDGDWEEACYITMARGLGFGTNAEPFQRLSIATPLKFLRRHADTIVAVEAILLGQSGLLLDSPPDDDYGLKLRSEYYFYRKKFALTPLTSMGWKAGRPDNSPQRRIAFLASLISRGSGLLSQILEATTMDKVRSLLSFSPTGYWEDHYSIGSPSQRILGALSPSSIDLLIINVIAPLLMARGIYVSDETLKDRAINFLQSVPPEKNRLVKIFKVAGLVPQNAFESQALVELRRNLCETRKCLYCRFGHRLLSHQATRRV